MTEFRKRYEGRDAWHWSPACRQYPKASYDRRLEKPTDAVLCYECQMLEDGARVQQRSREAVLSR